MGPQIFLEHEAAHFCHEYKGVKGQSESSLEFFSKQVFSTKSTVKEGDVLFNEYRDCVLREVERLLFLSVSHYRRSLDLLMPSSAPWAHVTLYYGSFFAAKALLCMFGCYIVRNTVIDVQRGNPGSQEFVFRKIGNRSGQIPTTYSGSHERFWDLFYQAVLPLQAIVDSRLTPALSPVNNKPEWLSRQRNEVNYESMSSVQAMIGFQSTFSAGTFPTSLAGPLSTQYKVLELLLDLAMGYTKKFGLRTDTLDGLMPGSSLMKKISKLIYGVKSPKVVKKTIKRTLASL